MNPGDPTSTQLPGRIGRYELQEVIGRGRTSVVYRAYDSIRHHTVALKTIDIRGSAPDEREDLARRFAAGVQVAAALSHPAIVSPHDAGRDGGGGLLFLAFEEVEGSTADTLAASGRSLPWREALEITRQVADALHYAHGKEIVHGGLAPAKVLVSAAGEARILGFGSSPPPSATSSPADPDSNRAAYSAPERVRSEPIDARADVFSLGAVAYRLLTGRDAFAGEDIATVCSHVLEADPPPASQFVPGLPSGVDAILRRALAKSRDDRYRDAQRLSQDVSDVLNGRAPGHCVIAKRRPWAGPAEFLEPDHLGLEEVQPQVDPTIQGGPAALLTSRRPLEPAEAPTPQERTAFLRRSYTRSFTAVALLAMVVVVEVWRRHGEGPGGLVVPVAPPLSRPASPAPSRAPPPRLVTTPSEPRSAPLDESPSPAAEVSRLVVYFEHGFESGTLTVFVDDRKVLQQGLSSQVTKRVLGLRRRRGRVLSTLSVQPGLRRVRVLVKWDESERSETATGTFGAGSSRRLVARLSRIGKDLSLDWD